MKSGSSNNDNELLIFNKTYQVQKRISSGSFGVVYSGLNLQTGEIVALKLEKNNSEDEILSVLREATLLNKVQGIKGIPNVFWSGTKDDYDALVDNY